LRQILRRLEGEMRAAENVIVSLRLMLRLIAQPVTITSASPFAGRAALNACCASALFISTPAPLLMLAIAAGRKNNFSIGT